MLKMMGFVICVPGFMELAYLLLWASLLLLTSLLLYAPLLLMASLLL
jgi:hypothetical protein